MARGCGSASHGLRTRQLLESASPRRQGVTWRDSFLARIDPENAAASGMVVVTWACGERGQRLVEDEAVRIRSGCGPIRGFEA